MRAWSCFTRVTICLLVFATFSFSINAKELDPLLESRQKKLDSYSHLAATAIFNWNTNSEVSNNEIVEMVSLSNLQNDVSSEGVIFRHILATYTANIHDAPRIPVYVKTQILETHWEELKTLSPELFAAAKSYYIFAKAANNFDGSDKRAIFSIPALRRLKLETIETGSMKAVAIISMWLASELTLTNPIEAINEIEYALPHLPKYSPEKNLVNALSDMIAHDLLRKSYLELFVPSKAFYHSMEMIAANNSNSKVSSWAYFAAIDALLVQNRFEEAQSIAKDAQNFVEEKGSIPEKLLILAQTLRITVFQRSPGFQDSAQVIIDKIKKLDTSDFEQQTKEISIYINALSAAGLSQTDSFKRYVEQYKDVVLSNSTESGFKQAIRLNLELELSKLYEAAGDYENAYFHIKAYNQLLVEKNTEQFKLSSSSFTDGIAEDIELARYRQKELSMLRDEKDGLSSDKEAMQTTIFALITTILIILALWLWIAKRQSDLIAETDSLTGALTRRAMLNSLKKSLKGDKTSCIALLDIDNFKKINDKYGHLVGDEVLTTFTQIIQNRVRKSDKLCRYGGEEFLIYFSDTDTTSAKRILDELNVALSRQKFWTNTDEKFSVSFSSGLLDVKGETNLDTIIKACDALLYKAKREGRARVASFPI